MAYSSIVKSGDYFNTVTYTANASGQSITGVGFQPDFLWIKARSAAYQHSLRDVIRGSTKTLRSNDGTAEQTQADSVTSFDSDGFTLGADSSSFVNQDGATYVAWNWLGANGTASNGNGSISSTVSANTTAGFSIVSYTGNSTSGATVGHGLSSAPKFVIGKARNTGGEDWFTGNASSGFDKYIKLNSNHAAQTFSGVFNDTAPSSTVVTLGNNGIVNSSSYNYIMYCFAEVKGYSKIGSYTGNGNADGTFVYTGFKPAFVMVKCTSDTDNWNIHDSVRNEFNLTDNILYPNLSNAEGNPSVLSMDLLSQGFKFRGSDGGTNGSGRTYIYMAFAEEPFVGNDSGTAVPVTAR